MRREGLRAGELEFGGTWGAGAMMKDESGVLTSVGWPWAMFSRYGSLSVAWLFPAKER